MTTLNALVAVYEELGRRAAASCSRKDGSLENKVWYLRANRLFAHATEASVEDSAHLFRTTLYPKRALVFEPNDQSRTVYLVKHGRIRIARLTPDGKEVTVAMLGAGDLFGEETLFGEAPRTTVAICMEETLLCTARAEDMFALLSRDPQLALNVAQILSERLGDASAAMEDLAYARVPDRIVNLFSRLAEEHGVPDPRGVRIDVRLTHADIASLIGSTRETVSLELAALVRSGRLIHEDRSFVVPASEVRTAG